MDKKGNYLALCLLEAIEDESEVTAAQLLTKYGADPNIVIQDRGIAPIHYVCGMENVEFGEKMIKLILYQHQGNPNVCSDENITPLHIAAMYGRTNIVKMLLEKGGDISAMDNDRKTPISYAVIEDQIDVVKVIQNYVFEQKFNKTKERILIRKNSVDSPTLKKQPSLETEPVNNNLLTVKTLEAKKFTPNRINYNFDATSPFYINITHRRKVYPKEAEENENIPITSTPLEENVCRRQNLFKLTEESLSELSKNLSPERSRVSLIKTWRDKVQQSRSRSSILHMFDNIDDLLSGVMTNDELDFTNTLLTNDEDTAERTVSPKKSLLRTSFGKMIENIESAESFRTAPEDEPVTSPNQNESNFIKSPRNGQYIVQMSEEYVHTDTENGLVFYERKFLTNQNPSAQNNQKSKDTDLNTSTVSTNLTLPADYETEALRAELTLFGEPPGPITKSTKKLYIKRLIKYKRNTEKMIELRNERNGDQGVSTYSVELEKTVKSEEWFTRISDHLDSEKQMLDYFKNSPREITRKFREGNLKQSFIYLLIDPRISSNLPAESAFMSKHDVWKMFVNSIFYVGKGKSARPYAHLYDALKMYSKSPPNDDSPSKIRNAKVPLIKSPRNKIAPSKKIERILDVWSAGKGVVCLHVFHNILPAEAFTREAAIIDALSMQHLTNKKRGDYYGPAQSWTMRCKKNVGIVFLFKALQIYLAEGESQLSPCDLI